MFVSFSMRSLSRLDCGAHECNLCENFDRSSCFSNEQRNCWSCCFSYLFYLFWRKGIRSGWAPWWNHHQLSMTNAILCGICTGTSGSAWSNASGCQKRERKEKALPDPGLQPTSQQCLENGSDFVGSLSDFQSDMQKHVFDSNEWMITHGFCVRQMNGTQASSSNAASVSLRKDQENLFSVWKSQLMRTSIIKTTSWLLSGRQLSCTKRWKLVIWGETLKLVHRLKQTFM